MQVRSNAIDVRFMVIELHHTYSVVRKYLNQCAGLLYWQVCERVQAGVRLMPVKVS